jgi:hypothetical protein
MTLKFEIVKNNLDNPNFSEEFGYFYDTRAPNSEDDDYINSIPFGTDFLSFWWDQSTNNIYQLTNWGNTPLVWAQFANNQNLLSLISANGWEINTSRTYGASGISLNTARQPNLTNDTFVIASINQNNTLSTTTACTVQVSVDNVSWITAASIGEATGIVSNKTTAISFWVPAGYYYQLESSGTGTVTLVSCNELTM